MVRLRTSIFINTQLLSKEINLDKLKNEWVAIKNEFSTYISNWYNYNYQGENYELVNILRNKEDIPLSGRYRVKANSKIIEHKFEEDYVSKFIEFETNYIIKSWYPLEKLIENSRISAKKNMTVANLFTKRTLSCHSKLLELINKHSTGEENNLLKLAFTANLANCSKLVPPIKSRGEMSQGAWMTGFYIGDTYIENNVLDYFENRLNKIIKGKIDYINLAKKINTNITYNITQNDAKKLEIESESIDYVFTDPPYGDAVPYFEQSIIWNSWLNLKPNYLDEIVISDSKIRGKNVGQFEKDIYDAFSEIRRVLKMGGFFSLTYHSLSGKEWKAITNACIKCGFELVEFDWLTQKTFTPRQINRSKSIKGDVLVTFQKSPNIKSLELSDSQLTDLFITEISSWLLVENIDTNEIFLRVMKIILTQKIVVGNIDLLNTINKEFKFIDNKWTLNDKLKLQSAR